MTKKRTATKKGTTKKKTMAKKGITTKRKTMKKTCQHDIKMSYDYEIKKDYNNLVNYFNQSDFYKLLNKTNSKKNRLDRLRILGQIGDTGIYFKYAPNRKVYNLIKNDVIINSKLEKRCPLCLLSQANIKIYPINLVRSILWRDYIISANTYPYFKNHMLVLSTTHNHGLQGDRGTQYTLHKNKNVINDMIDLYVLLGQKGTMFFNGVIGNSQLHFHFQITSENVPIQQLLHNFNKADLETLNTKKNNKITLFRNDKKDCLNGIIFYGNYKTLGSEIFKFLKSINKKGLLYNILFIENKNKVDNGKVTVIVYLRKKIKNENVEDFNMGSTSVGGILLTAKLLKYKLNNPEIVDKIQKYCNVTVIKPNKQMFKNII